MNSTRPGGHSRRSRDADLLEWYEDVRGVPAQSVAEAIAYARLPVQRHTDEELAASGLTGTPRQIDWALDIRSRSGVPPELAAQVTEARWWIERRDRDAAALARMIRSTVTRRASAAASKAAALAAREQAVKAQLARAAAHDANRPNLPMKEPRPEEILAPEIALAFDPAQHARVERQIEGVKIADAVGPHGRVRVFRNLDTQAVLYLLNPFTREAHVYE